MVDLIIFTSLSFNRFDVKLYAKMNRTNEIILFDKYSN